MQAGARLKRRLLLLLDALRGCEGARLSTADLRAFYDRQYTALNPELDADDAPAKAERLVNVIRAANLGRVERVLEIGCGSGAILQLVGAALGAKRAAGVDYGLPQAVIARRRTGFAVAVAAGADLPFRKHEFDLAIVVDVLEHVLDPGAVLKEAAEVANHVAFFAPLEAGLVASPIYAYRRVRGKRTNREQYGHIWRWFRPEVEKLFRRANLEMVASAVEPPANSSTYGTAYGHAFARARAAASRLSTTAAEVLFGGYALVGVARRLI